MKANKKEIVIIVILVISILMNIVFAVNLLMRNVSKSIIGTYCTGNGESMENLYIVFQQEGEYTLYKQNQLLEEGSYEMVEDTIYSLHTTENDEVTYAVFDQKNLIYLYDQQDNLDKFKRIYDKPMYLNLPDRVE